MEWRGGRMWCGSRQQHDWLATWHQPFVVINKAGEPFPIRDLTTSLKPGKYHEVHQGWDLDVAADGKITAVERAAAVRHDVCAGALTGPGRLPSQA